MEYDSVVECKTNVFFDMKFWWYKQSIIIQFCQRFLFSIQHLGEREPACKTHPTRHLEGQNSVEVVALLGLRGPVVASSSSTSATAISTPRGGNSHNTAEKGGDKNLDVNVTLKMLNRITSPE